MLIYQRVYDNIWWQHWIWMDMAFPYWIELTNNMTLKILTGYTTWFTGDYYDPRKGFGSREFAGNHQNWLMASHLCFALATWWPSPRQSYMPWSKLCPKLRAFTKEEKLGQSMSDKHGIFFTTVTRTVNCCNGHSCFLLILLIVSECECQV